MFCAKFYLKVPNRLSLLYCFAKQMSSVLNFLPHLLIKLFSLIFFFPFLWRQGCWEGAEHNNLVAKHTFLALVSDSNATASSLLNQDIRLMRSLFQAHNWKKTHYSKSAPTLQMNGGTNWKGKRREGLIISYIAYTISVTESWSKIIPSLTQHSSCSDRVASLLRTAQN